MKLPQQFVRSSPLRTRLSNNVTSVSILDINGIWNTVCWTHTFLFGFGECYYLRVDKWCYPSSLEEIACLVPLCNDWRIYLLYNIHWLLMEWQRTKWDNCDIPWASETKMGSLLTLYVYAASKYRHCFNKLCKIVWLTRGLELSVLFL